METVAVRVILPVHQLPGYSPNERDITIELWSGDTELTEAFLGWFIAASWACAHEEEFADDATGAAYGLLGYGDGN